MEIAYSFLMGGSSICAKINGCSYANWYIVAFVFLSEAVAGCHFMYIP